MAGSISNLIADFSMPSKPEGFGLGLLRRVKQIEDHEAIQSPPSADRQVETMQAAVVEAREQEKAIARRQLEEALDAERERHAEELAVQRELWVEQEALQLSSQIIKAVGNLEAALSDQVARILTSVIPEALRQTAIAEFNQALGTMLSGEVSGLLRVTGPEDILRLMKEGMSLREGMVEFVPADHVEVTLIAGDTTIQTQFSPWAGRLQELLRQDKNV